VRGPRVYPYRLAVAVKRYRAKERRWSSLEELLLECGHVVRRRQHRGEVRGAYCTSCPQVWPVKLIPDDFCHVCFHPGHEGPCTVNDYDAFLDVGSVVCGCREMTTRQQRNEIEVTV
jgi:hypothetical protein